MSIEVEVPPAEAEAAAPPSYTIEQILTGIAMALIVLVTFGNVLVRYFTSQSFAATEEFSIALMIVVAFLGSSVAFAFDRHIRVSFFVERMSPRARIFFDWLAFAATAGLFAFIAVYAGLLTWDQYRFEETSPALGVPQWWYTVWMPVLSATLVLRLVVNRLRRRA